MKDYEKIKEDFGWRILGDCFWGVLSFKDFTMSTQYFLLKLLEVVEIIISVTTVTLSVALYIQSLWFKFTFSWDTSKILGKEALSSIYDQVNKAP